MTERWEILIPGEKVMKWEGLAQVNHGTLSLYKPNVTIPTLMFSSINWTKATRTTEDPPTMTSEEIASIAARGLSSPETLSPDEVQRVCASLLSGRGE